MQLNRLVSFHKALGDATRIRILSLLKQGPLHGQAIAGKLGLRPPTITHHMTKLREVGLIKERRDKNTIYFHLDERKLEAMARAILTIGNEEETKWSLHHKESMEIISHFVTTEGKLRSLPAQRKKRMIVLAYFAKELQVGKTYTEDEINVYIRRFFADYATVRREFVMNHYMHRENNQYECNPKEMWPVEV
ncbi:metalloregulator ArsR/SmtB family transcription factor [Bacillus tianshenii]|nr:metalloregulator ArsR/SmtB family transcription factor [Bacillus tianshenii]